MTDAGIASRDVGYASASTFSAECGRFFGAPSAKDVNGLREHFGAAADESIDPRDRFGNMTGQNIVNKRGRGTSGTSVVPLWYL